MPRTTLGEVLGGRRFPSKAFLLTFVELCGVDPVADPAWEATWNRLAVRYKVDPMPGQAPARTDDVRRQLDFARQETRSAQQRVAQLEEELERLRGRAEEHVKAIRGAVSTWAAIANLLELEGRWALVEKAFATIVDLQNRVFGEDDQAALQLRRRLITAVVAQGRYADAEAAVEQLLDDCCRLLGSNHPDTLAVRQVLRAWPERGGAAAHLLSASDEAAPPSSATVIGREPPIPVPPVGASVSDERIAGGLPEIWNVEPRNPEFTGRSSLLQEIRHRLHSGSAAVVQALRGLGGVGKTQIAIEYAHRFSADYDLVWWIASEDPALVGEQVAALAVALSLVESGTDTTTAVAVLKAHLRGRDRWLLIFDNAEERTGVAEWLPGGPGHVLITSRSSGWEPIAATVHVDVMARAESVALLRTHHSELDAREADVLADALADLPLALAQAGGFLAETATSVDEYLDLLDAHAAVLLGEGATGAYPRPLAAAVRLSTERLAQFDPIGLAAVRVCSALAPESVPVHWLLLDAEGVAGAADEPLGALVRSAADPVALRRGVGSAVRLGLATTTRDGVRLHRLVKTVLLDHLPPEAKERVRDYARAALVANDPGDPENPATWPTWARLVPHLLAVGPTAPQGQDLRSLACNAAWYLVERGDADAGARLATDLRRQWTASLGPDDFHVLWATRGLARAYREQGRYEDARLLYDDALNRSRRVLGDEHAHTLRLAHGSAINLRLLGQYERARELQSDALARYRRVLGDDHPHTLHSANHLAVDLSMLGQHEQARGLHEQTLARYRRVLGNDHPDTLRSANHLAVDLSMLGQYDRARRLHEHTLARCRQVFGEDHPHALRSANAFATTLRKLGQLQPARELQEDTLARYRRVLGRDHPHTLRAAHNLCETLHELGDLRAARELQEDTLTRYRRVLGDDHPETMHSVDHLTVLLTAQREAKGNPTVTS